MASELGSDVSISQVQFRRAIADCIRLHRVTLGGTLWSNALHESVDMLRRLLAQIWGEFARIYAARTASWIADLENPGYLMRKAHHAEVRVPYHLAPDFPNDQTLDELVDIALAIRIGGLSVICLSGSSTFWEALRIVADVDFCEYVPVTTSTSENPLSVRLLRLSEIRTDRLVCIEVKVYNTKGDDLSLDSPQDLPAIFRAKLRFITFFSNDVVEATNLVLQSTRGSVDPALKLSNPAQEAPIINGSWVPQELLDPMSLGRYADWLMSEVSSKWDSNPTKAAKRGISLARITGYPEHGNHLISILQKGTGLVEAAMSARSGLFPAIQELVESYPDIGQPLMRALKHTNEKLRREFDARRLGAEKYSAQGTNDLKKALTSLLRDVSKGVNGASLK